MDWLYISVSINKVNASIYVLVYNNKSMRNNMNVNLRSNKVDLVDLSLLSLTYSLDTTKCPENQYVFEVSSFIFTPNYWAESTDTLALYRIRRPPNCESNCKIQCSANLICPQDQRFSNDIELSDVYAENPQLRGSLDPKILANLPLFRTTTSYFGVNLTSAPSFDKYLIGFEIYMKGYFKNRNKK